MITKFDSLFAGHIDMDNVGYGGVPVNDRSFPNEKLATVFDKAQAMAELMDRVGYDTFWMAEHHFQHEGYECLPNILMLRGASGACHKAAEDRLRLQHHADVAPAAPRRGLRDRRHPDQGPHRVRGRPRLSQPRGRDLRRADASTRTANRELFEEQVEILFKAFNNECFSHKGKHYTMPAGCPLSRLPR